MASANMKDIKRRIKSVESTMQITKAMELVASSKVRKARERVETSRPYFNILFDSVYGMARECTEHGSVYLKDRAVQKSLFIVIAGDRGLAGGYNGNILKLALSMMEGKDAMVIPVGKKAPDFFQRRGIPLAETRFVSVEEMDQEACEELGDLVADMFCRGEADEVYLVYTDFTSMLAQDPTSRKLLPLHFDRREDEQKAAPAGVTFEPSMGAVLDKIIPQYMGGVIYGAVCESFASEQSARRMAMEAATTNAEDMISGLSLKYNRARQGAITQELNEIVAGAEALK